MSKREDEIREALEVVAAANDEVLRPADVVESARRVSNPLHNEFTWDDTAAAKAHRLWQARELILSVYVEVVSGDPKTVTRAYVSLHADRKAGGGYRPVVEVLSSAQGRAALLGEAKQEMTRFVRKYKALVELAPVVAAMHQAMRRRSRKAS